MAKKSDEKKAQAEFAEWENRRRAIVRMMQVEGLTVKQVAHELGTTTNAVYKVLEKMRHRFNAKTNYQLFAMIGEDDQLAGRPFERWV